MLPGCGPRPGTDPDSGQASSEGSGDSTAASSFTGPTTTGMDTTTDETVGTTVVDDDTGPPATTTEPGGCGVPPYVACDPLAPEEECGGDQECTFDYHPKGGGWACGCDYGELGPFEECTTTSEPGDDCAAGQICAFAGQGAPGQCFPLCGSPLCTDDLVCQGNVCQLPCDPLGPDDCPGALYCGPGIGSFVCEPSTALPPDQAGLGEPCTGSGGCVHGLLCRTDAPGCTEASCCTAVCDASAMDPCPLGQTCTLLFDAPRPGSEMLGVCTAA